MNIDGEIISAMLCDAECAHRGCMECELVDFTDADCKRIFSTMLAMNAAGTPIDLITVCHMFDESYWATIAAFGSMFVTTANFAAWIQLIKERRQFREFRAEMSRCIQLAQEESPDTLDAAESAIARIRAIGGSEVMRVGTEAIEAVAEMGEPAVALSTGFLSLDKVLGGGFFPGNLVIVAGRPSMGKSSLAMNFAVNLCRRKKTVAVFSIEDSRKALERRMAQRLAMSSMKDVRQGIPAKLDALNEAAVEISEWSLYVNDKGVQTAQSILADCYRIKAQESALDLVIVDYLGLVKVREKKNGTRQQEVGEITRAMKLLAKDLGTTVVLVSQLNRALESRENKKPVMSDLRESGDIEQDADVIIFPFRPGVYLPDSKKRAMSMLDREIAEREAWLIVGKNRNGRTGDLRAVWQGEYYTFSEVAHG